MPENVTVNDKPAKDVSPPPKATTAPKAPIDQPGPSPATAPKPLQDKPLSTSNKGSALGQARTGVAQAEADLAQARANLAEEENKPLAVIRKVYFQFDKDQTIEANVVHEYKDGLVDLEAGVAMQSYTPPSSSSSSSSGSRIFKRVRYGSKFEPGTFFEIPSEEQT